MEFIHSKKGNKKAPKGFIYGIFAVNMSLGVSFWEQLMTGIGPLSKRLKSLYLSHITKSVPIFVPILLLSF